MAEKICGTAGVVDKNMEGDSMGDGFVRVRVKVDISKPLCRGRVISLENGKEIWVSFKYERLSNLCYWCMDQSITVYTIKKKLNICFGFLQTKSCRFKYTDHPKAAYKTTSGDPTRGSNVGDYQVRSRE